jgi:hypothetical protein
MEGRSTMEIWWGKEKSQIIKKLAKCKVGLKILRPIREHKILIGQSSTCFEFGQPNQELPFGHY